MIFGNVNNEFFDQQTAILPAPLKSALCFLKETDLAAHEPGRFEIELGGVPMAVSYTHLPHMARLPGILAYGHPQAQPQSGRPPPGIRFLKTPAPHKRLSRRPRCALFPPGRRACTRRTAPCLKPCTGYQNISHVSQRNPGLQGRWYIPCLLYTSPYHNITLSKYKYI